MLHVDLINHIKEAMLAVLIIFGMKLLENYHPVFVWVL